MSVTIHEEKREEGSREGVEAQSEAIQNQLASSVVPPSSSLPVSVRAYSPADYAVVLGLWEAANMRPFTPVEIERLLSGGGGALVAVQQKQVVGVVLWSHNGSIGILWRLAVAEAARGQGIATRLLDRAEQDIRALGLSGVSLLTRVNNTIAKGMYTRRGYRWNDHLEFWGKKLPAITENTGAGNSVTDTTANASGAAAEEADADITGEQAGGRESC